MSDTYLRLIPTDPKFAPTPDERTAAETILRKFVPGADVTSRISHDVEFVDAGENSETIRCPFCETELGQNWWASAMNAAYETRFTDLGVETPCCRRQTTLNDLRYEMPAGFARFVLEAANPNLSEAPAKLTSELELLLGVNFSTVWTRY